MTVEYDEWIRHTLAVDQQRIALQEIPPPVPRPDNGLPVRAGFGALLGKAWLISFGAVFAVTVVLTLMLVPERYDAPMAMAVVSGVIIGAVASVPTALIVASIGRNRSRGIDASNPVVDRRLEFWAARETARQDLLQGRESSFWGAPIQVFQRPTPPSRPVPSRTYSPSITTKPSESAEMEIPRGVPVSPLEVIALSAAVSRAQGGYKPKESSGQGTPQIVANIILDGAASDIKITAKDLAEAQDALAWARQGGEGSYRQQTKSHVASDLAGRTGIHWVASVIGAYRRKYFQS